MSEEEIEIKMPIYTTEELNAIDNAVMNDFDNLVSTAIKHIYRDRECIILQEKTNMKKTASGVMPEAVYAS